MVEGAERFIKEEDAGTIDERASERDALPLATGELCWTARVVPLKAHHAQRILDAHRAFRRWNVAHLKPVGNILRNAHVREEGVILEDGVDVAIKWRKVGDVVAVKEDSTRGWSLKARDHAQRGCLP